MRGYNEELSVLKQRGLFRRLTTIEKRRSSRIVIDGKEMILLSSNDYLGLSDHPELIKAAIKAAKEYGIGTGASRLLSGNLSLHNELENRIAQFKETEASLVFSTGYMANIGIISTIMKEKDLIIGDRLNHASIVDGCKLSRAKFYIYKHKDIDDLQRIVSTKRGQYDQLFIITDSVFSMDGDIAPLPQLLDIAKDNSGMIMIDDAHATGVLGKNGKGISEHFNLKDEAIIQMGTFGKALGTFGAYITGDKEFISYLINSCKPFIYTTSLPPHIIAATITAIDIVEKDTELKEKLWKNREYFCQGVRSLGYDTFESETPIVPIMIGDSDKALKVARGLFENGIYAPAIRPP
ncbi:MAG: 8-amino-7-oxononanoate synthase, partial [Nitrospirota bacterium]